MEFSKKLKKLRKEKGVSQQILANAVFVSRSAVAKWENGLGLPSEESLEGLANFFNIPKEFFKTDTPEIIVVEKNKKIKKLSGLNLNCTELHPKYWTDPRHSGDRAHLFSVNGWWEATQS